jgi:hypothetical protein
MVVPSITATLSILWRCGCLQTGGRGEGSKSRLPPGYFCSRRSHTCVRRGTGRRGAPDNAERPAHANGRLMHGSADRFGNTALQEAATLLFSYRPPGGTWPSERSVARSASLS